MREDYRLTSVKLKDLLAHLHEVLLAAEDPEALEAVLITGGEEHRLSEPCFCARWFRDADGHTVCQCGNPAAPVMALKAGDAMFHLAATRAQVE